MWISPKFALQVIQTFLAVSAVSETPRTNPDLTDLSTRLSSLEAQMAALETQMAALHPHRPSLGVTENGKPNTEPNRIQVGEI
jgi:hypothetical protein